MAFSKNEDLTKEEFKFLLKISKKVGKTIQENSLIQENDKILVALSGGKDSLILLETLAERKKHMPFKFDIYAIHVKMKEVEYVVDEAYLNEFCKNLNIRLFIETASIDISKNKSKKPCFICSWQRRKIIFAKARNLGCNKMAFGHHLDDAIETLLLNMIYHGSVSSLPHKIDFFDGEIQMIRPLIEQYESDLIKYAEIRKFKKQKKNCPYENKSSRADIRELVKHIDSLYHLGKKNIFRSMKNMYPEYLPYGHKNTSE